MLTFLPLSHPQTYLPMLFRVWESINSYTYDERMLAFLSQLAELHVDPTQSDPRLVNEIPDDAVGEGESRVSFDQSDLKSSYLWTGVTKEVGIFTEDVRRSTPHSLELSDGRRRNGSSLCASASQAWVRMKRRLCRAMLNSLVTEIPLADSGSLTTGPSVDNQAGFEIGRLPKPTWRICVSIRFVRLRAR